MTIVYYDGSTLECGEIEVYGNELICDGYRVIPLIEVQRITEEEE